MSTAFDRSKRPGRSAGFVLFEVVLVIALMGALLTLASVYLIRGGRRLKKATAAAHARDEIASATDRLRNDIRSAVSASVGKQSVSLTRADSSVVTWGLKGGRLVRTATNGQTIYQAPIRSVRVRMKRLLPGAPFIEMGITLDRPGGSTRDVFYVGASPRAKRQRLRNTP